MLITTFEGKCNRLTITNEYKTVCNSVKITGKQRHIASNKLQKQIEMLSNKIGCIGIAETKMKEEAKQNRFNKKKAFYNK